jgi:hypothetical protein
LVDLSIIQPVSQVAAAIGVCIAATYYVITLRAQQTTMRHTLETRQTQIFMELYKMFASKDFMQDLEEILLHWKFKDHADFYRQYGSDVDPVKHAKFDSMLQFFDGIGILVERKLIDPNIVYAKMRFAIIAFWEKYESVVVGDRALHETPKLFSYVEYLYDQVKPFKVREDEEFRARFSK